MSESYFEFHNVTATEDTAVGIAEYAQRWLERSTWPCRLAPTDVRGGIVQIVAHEWVFSGANGNWEGPRCPICRDVIAGGEGALIDQLDEWFATKQPPVLTCDLCDTQAPMTQWDLTYAGVFSYVSMATAVFDNPEELCAQLNKHTSGKWVWISAHL